MKRFFVGLLLMLICLSFAPSVYAVNKKQAKKIDLNMTLKFIEGWSSRDKWDKFPESPSFAFYNVYSMKMLKGDISPELRNKIVDYLKNCQMKDGGFASHPEYDKTSNTVFTYYALRTLDLLDALESINRRAAIEFILSLAQSDGSIRAKFNDETASLSTTYYGIASLAVINAVNRIDVPKTIIYINSYREPHKGYCMIKGAISMPASTYMGVKSLMLMNALTEDIKHDVVAYLKASRYSGQVQGKKYSTLPAIEDLAYVLETLADLSSINVVNKEKVTAFVESLYIPENGGFGPEPGLGMTPPSTYYAILCLNKLGRIGNDLR